MNRVSLFAVAAVLLLSNPAATFAQEKTMTTSTGMELVWIPSGEFMMGSTPEEKAWAVANGCKQERVDREGEQPRRIKIAQPFWMARTELTVAQWKKFADATSFMTDAEKNG